MTEPLSIEQLRDTVALMTKGVAEVATERGELPSDVKAHVVHAYLLLGIVERMERIAVAVERHVS